MHKTVLSILILFALYACGEAKVETENQSNDVVPIKPVPEEVSNDWLQFPYDSVVAYLYRTTPSEEHPPQSIVTQGELNQTIVETYNTDLGEGDVIRLGRVLSANHDEEEVSECFEPHHGVVFYNHDTIIAHISLCFMCNNLRANPRAYNTSGIRSLKSLFEKYDFPIFNDMRELEQFVQENMQE